MRIANTIFEKRSLAAARSENDQLRTQLNRYAGAQPSSPRRPIIPAFYRDARFDANQWSRYEMARKIRDHERNVWLIGRLKSIYSQYSVGPNGLKVVPASSDAEWNKRCLERFEKWCLSPAVDSALPMGEQHQLMADTTHIDGGVFKQFTYLKPRKGQSVPAIQLIEGHRVGTPGGSWAEMNGDHPSVIDGVQIDGAGRPIGYHIRESVSGEDYAFRPIYDPLRPWAGGVMHVYDPDRIGQYREITPYHAVINQIQDLELLRLLEMDRAKENASVAYHMETVDGELPNAQNLLRKNFNATTPTGALSDPDAELQKRIQQYQTQLGSKVLATKIGEKLNQLGSESPSAATQWYWLQLYEEITETVNIPLVVVLPRSYQGTVARGIYDNAHIWFTDRFHTFCRPAVASFQFWVSWAVYQYSDLADPPADFRKAHVTPPRAINVDKGNSSASMLAEYAAGITNLDDLAGTLGTTARELTTKKARNVGLIKQIAAEESKAMGVEIKPEDICAPLAAVVQQLGLAEQSRGIGAQAQANADIAESKEANAKD